MRQNASIQGANKNGSNVSTRLKLNSTWDQVKQCNGEQRTRIRTLLPLRSTSVMESLLERDILLVGIVFSDE